MARWTTLLCLVCALGVSAGCASRGQVNELKATVAKLNARIDAADKQDVERNARIDALEKQAGNLEARLVAAEKLGADLDVRMKNSEKLSADAVKQGQATAADLDALKGEVKQVSGVATKSHELFIKSMENLRELYKRQFDALDEILNRAAPVATPPPAPK